MPAAARATPCAWPRSTGMSWPGGAAGATAGAVSAGGVKVFTRRAALSAPRAAHGPQRTQINCDRWSYTKIPDWRPPPVGPPSKGQAGGLKMRRCACGRRGYECSASLREPVALPLSRPGASLFPTQLCGQEKVEDSAVFCLLSKFQWEANHTSLFPVSERGTAVCPWPLQGFCCLTHLSILEKSKRSTERSEGRAIEFTGQHITVLLGSGI